LFKRLCESEKLWIKEGENNIAYKVLYLQYLHRGKMMSQGYVSNLSEEEWQLIASLTPAGKKVDARER